MTTRMKRGARALTLLAVAVTALVSAVEAETTTRTLRKRADAHGLL